MSIKAIIQDNPFDPKNVIKEVSEGTSLYKLLEELHINLEEYTPFIVVNDVHIEDYTYRVKDTDTVLIKIIPEGDNAGQIVTGEFAAGLFAARSSRRCRRHEIGVQLVHIVRA